MTIQVLNAVKVSYCDIIRRRASRMRRLKNFESNTKLPTSSPNMLQIERQNIVSFSKFYCPSPMA